MDIDIILEADVSPTQLAELAVEAENQGVRAIWSSNYHQNWDCFLALAPAAAATSKIKLGCLAVSPWELHPLKMANALLTLNEMSQGRAMIAVSGGGGVFGACGWKLHKDAPTWPFKDPIKGNRTPERRVRGVQECIEVLNMARTGKIQYGYEGEIFQITKPFRMDWAKSSPPQVYGCCSGPMMIRMGARCADAIQFSDYTVAMVPEGIDNVKRGLERREKQADDFRVGNFWAFHIKPEKDASMYEARRELIWRGGVVAKNEHEIRPFCDTEDEVQTVVDNRDNFFKAFWTRTGQIDDVPPDLVNRLIAGMSSAGDLSDLDRELERFHAFKENGLTELSMRVFDDPMDGIKLIGERVLPAVA